MLKFIRAAFHGMMELIYFLPGALLVSAWFIPPHRMVLWLLSLWIFYIVGYTVTSFISNKSRWLRLALQVLLTGVLSALLFDFERYAILFIILAFVIYTRGAQHAVYTWTELFPLTVQMVALLLYFIASVTFRYVDQLSPFMNGIYFGGLAALVSTMLMANQLHLQAESNYGKRTKKISNVVLRHNRFYLVLLLGVILLFAWFDTIRRWLIQLKEAIVGKINEWLASRQIPEEIPKDSSPPMQSAPMFADGDLEPALWAVILEKIVFYAVYVALIVGALIGLYFAIKRLIALTKRLAAWLRERWSQRGTERRMENDWGYVDEEQSLELFSKWKDTLSDQLHKWRERFTREPKWEDFANNRERIRYLYRRWVQRLMRDGYSFKQHLTPNELYKDWKNTFGQEARESSEHVKELIQTYNASRYGNKEPTDEWLDKWRKGHANFRS